MKHELIMENWRRYVNECEDPEMLEEGFKDVLIGLALLGGSMFGASSAQAKPVRDTGIVKFTDAGMPTTLVDITPRELQQTQKVITDLMTDAMSGMTDPKKIKAMKDGIKIINDKLQKTLTSPGTQDIAHKSFHGYDWTQPETARVNKIAISDATIVEMALEIALRQLAKQDRQKALQLKKEIEELTPTQKRTQTFMKFQRDQRRRAKNKTPEQRAQEREFAKQYLQNNPNTTPGDN